MKKINLFTEEDIMLRDRIDSDCLQAHLIPPIKTSVNLLVESSDGTPVLDLTMPSKSFVRNFYNLMAAQAMAIGGAGSFEAGSLALKGMTGTTWSQSGPHYLSAVSVSVGSSGDAYQGIVVGSGTTAESIESYTLATLIAHGTSAGQLSYAAQSATTWSYNATSKKISAIYQRVFQNTSGGDVTINEIGLVYNLSTGNSVLLNRDKLASPVVISTGQKLTVTYTMDITYPA